jgi:hypothetical protein
MGYILGTGSADGNYGIDTCNLKKDQARLVFSEDPSGAGIALFFLLYLMGVQLFQTGD